MIENPFADGVPTHMAIAATVYTKPLKDLQQELNAKKSRLIFVIGGYGNGKSHALERLKNDINVTEGTKLAIYTSAYATKSLKNIYSQIVSELISGKLGKLDKSGENRMIMESKGIPENIIDIFFNGREFRKIEDITADIHFGKVVTSSTDVINFLCALSTCLDQMVLLIDDIEEAATMDKSERQTFFGYIRALYDQAIRRELNMIIILAMTPDKLRLITSDRPDFLDRVDKETVFNKPTLEEISQIIRKRLEVSGLQEYKITKETIRKVYENSGSIRRVFNILRRLLDEIYEAGEYIINNFNPEEIQLPAKEPVDEYRSIDKPADNVIVKVLKEEEGLGADEIVKRSNMSDSWIKHRLADLIKQEILEKKQVARNKPALYYLSEKSKEGEERE